MSDKKVSIIIVDSEGNKYSWEGPMFCSNCEFILIKVWEKITKCPYCKSEFD